MAGHTTVAPQLFIITSLRLLRTLCARRVIALLGVLATAFPITVMLDGA